MRERLSAWMDDELPSSDTTEMLTAMGGNPEIVDTWSRYHLIGTTLRHGLPDRFDARLAERVWEAIGDATPEEGDAPTSASPGRPGWVKPVAGVAIAASVAAVAVFGVQMMEPAAPTVPAAASAADERPVVVRAMPAAASTGAEEVPAHPAAALDGETLDREQLARYLLRHNEIVNNRGVRGVLPYVRVVTQDGTTPTAVDAR